MKKSYIKNTLGAAIAAFAFVAGSANADSTPYTGFVSNVFTMWDDYTFATVDGTSGYYTGPNSAVAIMIDNAKRNNHEITVYIDNVTSEITVVQNN